MSSEDQGSDKQNQQIMIQKLKKEYKLKQKALSKAAGLIDLLKIQKNSKSQAIRNAVDKVESKYKIQIEMYKRKINALQIQLKKKQPIFQKEKKGQSWQKLNRSNSHQSFNKSKQKSKIASPSRSNYYYQKDMKSNLCFSNSIEKQIIKQTILELGQKEIIWIESLAELISQQTEQFEKYTTKYQQIAQQAKQALKNKYKKYDKTKQKNNEKYIQIIIDQQTIINELQILMKDLEDSLKSLMIRLNSTYENSLKQNNQIDAIDLTKLQQFLKNRVQYIKKNERQKQINLEEENMELKSILDGMIKLVREDKKLNVKTKN